MGSFFFDIYIKKIYQKKFTAPTCTLLPPAHLPIPWLGRDSGDVRFGMAQGMTGHRRVSPTPSDNMFGA